MDIFILIVVFGIFGAVIYYLIQSKKKRVKAEKAAQEYAIRRRETFTQEFVDYLQKWRKDGVPDIRSDIKLKASEKLYCKISSIGWNEARKRPTGNVAYSGLTVRIPIVKGLSYRAGAGRVIRETVDSMTRIDGGDLYFTNTGILFRGSLSNKSLPYSKIIQLQPLQDGIIIERDTGKDIYITGSISGRDAATIATLWDKDYLTQFE